MPDPLLDLSGFAEDAIGDVRLIVHDYIAARAAPTRTTRVGRFGGPGVGFGDRATQLAVANIVGVVEHYAERVLLDAGCSPGQVTNWGNKPSAWKNKFDADIEDDEMCPSFAPMRGYYEARNAIMHRRGELTHSQRKQTIYDRLAAAKVVRVGYDLVVTERTVHACADVCVRCVEELDETTKPTSGTLT
jgi:hypothetical protein